MEIISIDNCYEDDGLVQAQTLIGSFNHPNPDGTPQHILIAIIPEYREDGRLDRLNFCMHDRSNLANRLDLQQTELVEVAAAIVTERKRAHDAAVAKLSELIVEKLPPTRVEAR